MIWGRRGGAAFALIAAIILSGSVFCARGMIKEQLIDLDAVAFDGALRRLYHGQNLPILPAQIPEPAANAYAWQNNDQAQIIRHAVGHIALYPNNSVGALLDSISKGDRVIEGDVRLTVEGDLICYHGDDHRAVSTAEYLNEMSNIGAKACYFRDIAAVLRAHRDIYFVIDAKDDFVATYRKIIEVAPDIVGQLIPQIYDFEQILWVRQFDFAGAIFTSYRSALTTEQIFNYARQAEIKAVTLTHERAEKLGAAPTDISVFVHTIDDPIAAADLLKLGFSGVYSNNLRRVCTKQ
ncbi:hypothetical protein LPB41_21470 [Thalassospira sp. MA62]|nr:hypothetical protein [Thalassospira sp. MA62]